MSLYTEVKQHDTGNPWRGILNYRNAALDLTSQVTTGTPVVFMMRPVAGGALVVNRATAVVESVDTAAKTVTVRYQWTAPDVATAGTYLAEVEFTLSGGPLTGPTGGTFVVKVLADLG